MRKLLVMCLLGAGLVCSAYGQTKKQDIVRLLDITNTKSQANQMFDLMLPEMKQLAPQAPETFWTLFRSRMNVNTFVDLFVPIYDRYFSHEDIKELIRFYETPIGKKMLDVTPLITKESFAIGQEWGQRIGQEVVNELVKQGYY
jgi:hypothetical protein